MFEATKNIRENFTPVLLLLLTSAFLTACGGGGAHGEAKETPSVDFEIIKTLDLEAANDAWCGYGQWYLENFEKESFAPELVDTFIYTETLDFFSKPSVSNGVIELHAFSTSGNKAALGYDELWCKMKTPIGLINGGLNFPVADPTPKACHTLNQAAIEYALNHVPADIANAFYNRNIDIVFTEDQSFWRGDQWYLSNLRLKWRDETQLSIQASGLRTSNTIEDPALPDIIEAGLILMFGGMNYCKLISPKGAVDLVTDLAQPELVN